MKKYIYIILLLFVGFAIGGELTAKTKKRRPKARVQAVSKKKKATRRTSVKPAPRPVVPVYDEDGDEVNPYLMCEDTCDHVHGIDLSHYQGEVFWETVGENLRSCSTTLRRCRG